MILLALVLLTAHPKPAATPKPKVYRQAETWEARLRYLTAWRNQRGAVLTEPDKNQMMNQLRMLDQLANGRAEREEVLQVIRRREKLIADPTSGPPR